MKSRCQFWTTGQPGGAHSDFLLNDLCVSFLWKQELGQREKGGGLHTPRSTSLVQVDLTLPSPLLSFKSSSSDWNILCPNQSVSLVHSLYINQIFTVCCNALVFVSFPKSPNQNTYTDHSYYNTDSAALWNSFLWRPLWWHLSIGKCLHSKALCQAKPYFMIKLKYYRFQKMNFELHLDDKYIFFWLFFFVVCFGGFFVFFFLIWG